MTRDLYAEASALARELDDPEQARALTDAIAAGATGTEIHMALAWHLRRVAAGPSPLAARARELADAIDRALG